MLTLQLCPIGLVGGVFRQTLDMEIGMCVCMSVNMRFNFFVCLEDICLNFYDEKIRF